MSDYCDLGALEGFTCGQASDPEGKTGIDTEPAEPARKQAWFAADVLPKSGSRIRAWSYPNPA